MLIKSRKRALFNACYKQPKIVDKYFAQVYSLAIKILVNPVLKFLRNIIRLTGLMWHLSTSGVLFIGLRYFFSSREVCDVKTIFAKRLVIFCINAGPTFIKLGQVLSTRHDLVGEEIATKLASLRDDLAPFSFQEVNRIIEEDFRSKLSSIFQSFEKVPVAAASIAQVHKAVLMDGSVVGVKVARPGIRTKLKADLELLSFCVAFLEALLGDAMRRVRLNAVVQTLEKSVELELDLRHEAAAADQMAQNVLNDEGVFIPKIYWPFCSERILVMQWVEGIPIDDIEALRNAGYSMEDLATKLAITFFNQAYRDGFFHGDLHQGNIFVTEKGDIALVDFGITGILDRKDRESIAQIIYWFMKRDYEKVALLHLSAGYIPEDTNLKLFALACRSVGEPIIGLPTNEISISQLLRHLIDLTKRFDMPTQPQLLLLQKTMFMVEGVGSAVYPEVNMWKLAEPWIKQWASRSFGKKAQAMEAITSVRRSASALKKFSEDVAKIARGVNGKHHDQKKAPGSSQYLIAVAVGVLLHYIWSLL